VEIRPLVKTSFCDKTDGSRTWINDAANESSIESNLHTKGGQDRNETRQSRIVASETDFGTNANLWSIKPIQVIVKIFLVQPQKEDFRAV
jgi:hypothetical protein